jgi:hypothetical protein
VRLVAAIGQQRHQQHAAGAPAGVRRHARQQRPQRVARQQLGQQGHAQQQGEHQHRGAVAADARVLHDRQRLVARRGAEQRVTGVGQAVLVEGHRQPQAERHRQRRRHHGRPQRRCCQRHATAQRADGGTDEREMAHRLVQPARVETHPLRHRNPGQELQRDEEQAQFMTHGHSIRQPPLRSRRQGPAHGSVLAYARPGSAHDS